MKATLPGKRGHAVDWKLLDEFLARLILGMGLARIQDLYGRLGSLSKPEIRSKSLKRRWHVCKLRNLLPKPMVKALVEQMPSCFNHLIASPRLRHCRLDASSHKGKEQALECVVGFPKLAWIDRVDVLPYFRFPEVSLPIGPVKWRS